MKLTGNIIVIGDVMLDVYISGRATRLSPEAPVPVIAVNSKRSTLGGAGNVVLNLAGLGCRTWLFGARGNDHAGREVSRLLQDNGITDCLDIDPVLPTTTKTRIMANNQQLIRFDDEGKFNGYHGNYDCLVAEIIKVLVAGQVGAVVLSDYNKGVLSRELTVEVIRYCKLMDVPILVDPKRGDWTNYRGATLIKPNLQELREVTGSKKEEDEETIKELSQKMRESHDVKAILVTRGANGMILVTSDGHKVISATAREVFDVSGAGDTVIATLSACLCSGYSLLEAARIANVAAGVVVGKLGTSPINLQELQAAL